MIRLLHIFVLTFALLAIGSVGFSQDGGAPPIDGGLPPGIDGGGDGDVDNGIDNGNANNNQGGGGGGGGNAPGDVGELPTEVGEMIDDERSQGFVGPTNSAIESGNTDILGGSPGFVGPTAEVIESTSGGPQVQRDGGTAGRGSALGQVNGFVVSRSNVRARVVPNFSFPTVPTEVVSRDFQQRMSRLPSVQPSASLGIRVEIQGTTALISGVASNQQAIDDLMGQLRMEPGVYRIINDVRIANAANQNGSPSGLSSSSN